ncbi:TadE/TadG family type IV pilus assembly protein [Microvirga yunnanensis]|uniref:TadE/TadG family type IV pilus assembly protein n=1 Tax=Microvirga yunnanensis TaxID=2953740 RepID=UPI0021CA0B76|nr:TadE/TadG family type IV pilus assembly protein [Microvirga sp. HBU65207]
MPIRALRRILKSDTASVAVEFALILPVMLFIYLGGSYVSTLASLSKKLQTAAYAVNNLVPYPRDYCSYRAFVRNFHTSGGAKDLMGQFLAPQSVDGQTQMIQYSESAPDVDNLVTVKASARYSFNTGFWGVVNSVAAATPGASDSGGIVPSVFSLGATSAGVTVHKNPGVTCASGVVRLVGPAVTEFAVGEFNSFTVRAEDGIPAYQIRLKSTLPPGLNFTPNSADADVSGAITETCTTGACDPEMLNVTIEAEDSSSDLWAGSANTSSQKTFQIYLIHTLRLTVPSAVGTVGTYFRSPAPQRQGGKPGYTYSMANAPPGLAINASTGIVEGTPQIPGVYDQVSITVRDARGTVVTDDAFVYDIKPPALSGWGDGSFYGTGNSYGAMGIHARGGWGTITVTCSGFPAGVGCGPGSAATPYDGSVNGVPQQLGEGWGTITFRDSYNQTFTFQMYWNVKPPALNAWLVSNQAGQAGSYVRGDVAASGGWGNLTVESVSGPAGIYPQLVGYWQWAIHGTAPYPGSGPITVVIRDDAGQRVSVGMWFTYNPPPLYTSTNGNFGTAVCCTTSYTRYVYSSGGWGGKSPSASGIPAGMSLGWDGSTAWVTGRPSAAGSGTIWVTIYDSAGQASSQPISYNFTPAASTVTIVSTGAAGESLRIIFSEAVTITNITSNHSATGGSASTQTFVYSDNLAAHNFTITVRDSRGLSKTFTVAWPNMAPTTPEPCRPGRCG